MALFHINPESMHKNPYFSQATLIDGGRLLFIGEQNGVDATGAIVPGGAGAQAAQAVEQLKAILADVGADTSAVAKLTVYFSKDVTLDEVFGPAIEKWGSQPTAITVLQVYALARPDALVGIEAIVNLPALNSGGHEFASSVVPPPPAPPPLVE